jgi:glutathione S-transferase
MAGETFSLVDLYYIPLVARLFDIGDNDIIESTPNVKGWWERCMARPAVVDHVATVPKLQDIQKRLASSSAGRKL